MKTTWQPRKLRGDRITVREIEAEVLIYDGRTHRAWCLNPSSACIWQLCDGRNTVGNIAAGAAKELGLAVTEELVLMTIEELQEKGLLEGDMGEARPRDASRREMIQKLSLATAALLPVVAAITAPPALAQSGSAGTNSARRTNKQAQAPPPHPENKPSPSQDDDAYSR